MEAHIAGARGVVADLLCSRSHLSSLSSQSKDKVRKTWESS